jgi:hypothetical protein
MAAPKYDPKELDDKPDKNRLIKYLQAALQLELTTIPLYLTAMYSIKPGTNEEPFLTMRSVVLEEMLHMTLAANLVNALGGRVTVANEDYIPHYPAKMPYSSDVFKLIPLRHYSREALDTFILIESPPTGKPKLSQGGWNTIGQFYALIKNVLRSLAREKGAKTLFTGNDKWQIGPADFYNSGGEAFPVHDLDAALKAIEVIVEEGEGLGNGIFTSDDRLFNEERQAAHYFRFQEIRWGRRYGQHDTARDTPSGVPLEADWTYGSYPIEIATKVPVAKPRYEMNTAEQLVDDFNTVYARLLIDLHLSFNGKPEQLTKAIPTMLELRYRAEEIFRNPHPRDADLHLHPTFEVTNEMFRALGWDPERGKWQADR